MKTIEQIQHQKRDKKPITMTTAYDYPMASLVDEAPVDIILVGDSLANVVLGLTSTTEVGIKEILYHTKAVLRGVKNAMVAVDLPFETTQAKEALATEHARWLIDLGCQAVKLEWFQGCLGLMSALRKADIHVMGHVGLTPQTAQKTGGMKVRGRDIASANVIIEHAKMMQEAGCFSVVLECIPQELAKIITQQLRIPTIGIGAGPYCDGQVLVLHDVLGLSRGFHPKFSKQYVDLSAAIVKAVRQYTQEVTDGRFPGDAHSFHMAPQEVKKLTS